MKIGYARVSTTDQNLDLQTDALLKVGLNRNIKRSANGKDQPVFKQRLSYSNVYISLVDAQKASLVLINRTSVIKRTGKIQGKFILLQNF